MSLSRLVELLRLFHSTREDAGVGVFIKFFVSLYSTQSKNLVIRPGGYALKRKGSQCSYAILKAQGFKLPV